MKMCANLQEPTLDQLTLFAADTHANPFPQPGSDKARKMTATSGQNLCGSWLNSGPLGSLEKMLLGTSAWVSMTCWLTWKPKATPAGRLLFQLAPSVHRTGGTGSGLWPTPNCGMVRGMNYTMETSWRHFGEGRQTHLSQWVRDPRMWPTPTTRDHKGGRKPETLAASGRGETNSLNDAVTVRDQHGALNPEWVEWLMGFPVGWTSLEGE